MNQTPEEYQEYVKKKLAALREVFARAAVGDFSVSLEIPEEDDEFTELYVGIQVMLDVIREKITNLETEINQRTHIARELHVREEAYKALSENSPDVIVRFDKSLKIVYINPSVEKVTGIKPEGFIGKTAAEVGMPDHLNHLWQEHIQKVFTLGKEDAIEFDFPGPNGSIKFHARFVPERDPAGKIEYVLGVAHDVTEMKKVQEELKNKTVELFNESIQLIEEKAQDEAILKSIGEGIVVVDKEGKITLVNQAALDAIQYKESEIMGKRWAVDVPHIRDDKGNPIPYEQSTTYRAFNSDRVSSKYFYLRRDQSVIPVSVTASPVVLEGKVEGVVTVFKDITREDELDRLKDEFVSMASHELRTPMTAIKGLLSMIFEGKYGPYSRELQKPLSNIAFSTERLIRLVNDVLDVSRIESGKVVFHMSLFNLNESINKIITELTPIFNEKNLHIQLGPFEEAFVYADESKVQQILYNLLSNALKFTEHGTIFISLVQESQQVIIYVTDTGVGIADADQPKLFGKFQQLVSGIKDKPPGTGLGLYISKAYAQKMGGDLWLEWSHVGKGSAFAFSLPTTKK